MGVSTAPMRNGNGDGRRSSQSAALAKYPNVSVKLSSAPLISSEPYPFRDVTPHIKRLFDAYGPQRCYWGTDVTNSLAKATYRQRVTQFTEELTLPLRGRQGLDHGHAPSSRGCGGADAEALDCLDREVALPPPIPGLATQAVTRSQ